MPRPGPRAETLAVGDGSGPATGRAGGITMLDAAALVTGGAVASVHFREFDEEMAGLTLLGWALLVPAFAWLALTAAGPFVFLVRRFSRRPDGYPGPDDWLWLAFGLPWVVAALVRSGAGGLPESANRAYATCLFSAWPRRPPRRWSGSGGRSPRSTRSRPGPRRPPFLPGPPHPGRHGSAGPSRSPGRSSSGWGWSSPDRPTAEAAMPESDAESPPTADGFRIRDLAGLVVGYGLAGFLLRSFRPGVRDPGRRRGGGPRGVLPLARAGGERAVRPAPRPPGPAPAPRVPTTHPPSRYAGEELAWLGIGGYFVAIAVFVVPSTQHQTPWGAILAVQAFVAAWIVAWWVTRRQSREREPAPPRWTRRAAWVMLVTWPVAWVLLVLLVR